MKQRGGTDKIKNQKLVLVAGQAKIIQLLAAAAASTQMVNLMQLMERVAADTHL